MRSNQYENLLEKSKSPQSEGIEKGKLTHFSAHAHQIFLRINPCTRNFRRNSDVNFFAVPQYA